MRPMFFVVGAPRCGTTSLCQALEQHPDVCMSKPKEPHYFTRLPFGDSEPGVRDTYLRLFFSHLEARHRMMGEGSVSYLYSENAIRWTESLFPGSKYIVCVRNPIEMIYSYHGRLVSHMDEDVTDFRTAWELQEARAGGRHVPIRCRDPQVLQYAMIGSLGRHVERLLATVGNTRCKVVRFEEILADPEGTIRGVAEFLGLPHSGEITIKQRNGHKALRHPWLYGLLVRPPRPIQEMIAAVTGSHHKVPEVLRPIRRRVKRLTRIPAKRQPMDGETRDMLRAIFAEDISRLSRVLGLDLAHWQ